MYDDTYTEWGPARHRDESFAPESRDGDFARPDDN